MMEFESLEVKLKQGPEMILKPLVPIAIINVKYGPNPRQIIINLHTKRIFMLALITLYDISCFQF